MAWNAPKKKKQEGKKGDDKSFFGPTKAAPTKVAPTPFGVPAPGPTTPTPIFPTQTPGGALGGEVPLAYAAAALPAGENVPAKGERWKTAAESTQRALEAGEKTAAGITQTEEARGAKAEDFLTGVYEETAGPSMTDEMIAEATTASAEEAGSALMERMRSVRDYLGDAGITGGGLSAGLATQFELARMGQMTDAKHDLVIKKGTSDALDETRRIQQAQALAGVQMRDPSMASMDFLSSILLPTRLGQEGLMASYKTGKEASEAAEDAGFMDFIGSAIGGLGTAVGAFA